MSSKTGRATQRNPVSEKKEKEDEEERRRRTKGRRKETLANLRPWIISEYKITSENWWWQQCGTEKVNLRGQERQLSS